MHHGAFAVQLSISDRETEASLVPVPLPGSVLGEWVSVARWIPNTFYFIDGDWEY